MNKKYKWVKIFILLFLIVIIFLFNKDNQNKVLDFVNVFKGGEKTLESINSFENNNIIDMNIYNNTIVLWKENKIIFMNQDGELILEKDFSFMKPSIYYGEKYIYPFDKSTGDIYFLNENGETVNRLKLDKEIYDIKEIEEKLICHSKVENKEKIDIFNEEGVLIGNQEFQDKNVLCYDINKKANKILVSLLNLDDLILKSEINYYGKNNKKTDSLIIDKEIVVFNKLINNYSEIILTDRRLYYIKKGEKAWERQFNLVKDIYLEDDIYILHNNYLETIALNGETINKIGFTKDYKNIMNFDGNILLYGDENLAIVKNDKLILEYEEDILNVCTNDNFIFILGPEVLNIYQIGNK